MAIRSFESMKGEGPLIPQEDQIKGDEPAEAADPATEPAPKGDNKPRSRKPKPDADK